VDVGRRFQHGLDRGNDFALAVGAVLRDTGEFRVGAGYLLVAVVFEGAGPFQHQRRHQDQRQQDEPRADAKKLFEFHFFALETRA
jgi:hypothetical protein